MLIDRRAPFAALIVSLGPMFGACDEPGGQASSQLDGTNTDTVADTVADTNQGETDTAPTGQDADTTTAPDGQTGPPPIVDPSCVDGQYAESVETDLAPIADLVSTYSQADYLTFVNDVLERRYPLGAHLVREGNRVGMSTFGDCVERFTSRRSQASTLMRELSTVVHECGHILDIRSSGFSNNVYVITESLTFTCTRGDTTTRGGDTFARSLLNGDEYSALLPDDFYRDVYLDGDPTDNRFDGGDQGFSSVLEEATQYVNSLATDFYFRDQLGGFSITAKDGILTFLWYVQRYLRLARLEFPSAYQRLTTDSCWREAILTVWGRAWLYLEAARSNRQLGINAATIEDLVLDPNLLDEIERIRDAHGCR
jgi:hypothetical protein